MPLRLAFDLDGVLADMDSELLRQSRIIFPGLVTAQPEQNAATEMPDAPGSETAGDDSTPPVTSLQLSARQVSRLWRHVRAIEDFWETLTEIEPGVIARLSSLAAERRWEVIFLTKRPETAGATAQVQTQRWLESKGFTLPSVFVVTGSRGRIAASLGLDFVIDDRLENCLDVVTDSTARAILVWRQDEGTLPAAARRLGIGTVTSVGACLDILTEIDAPPSERPGVVDRVMRLLGLKTEPAGA